MNMLNHVLFIANMAKHIHNYGYRKTLGRWYRHLGSYTVEDEVRLKLHDSQRLRNSEARHQEVKKKSRLEIKDLPDDQVQYSAGFMYENHPLEGMEEYENLDNQSDQYRNPNLDGD